MIQKIKTWWKKFLDLEEIKSTRINTIAYNSSQSKMLYDDGWIDGWNACRSEQPDKREFMTRYKMLEREQKSQNKGASD
jgi:hypothetical protein